MQITFLDSNLPSDVAVSAARTCYFPNGIITPKESKEWKKKPELLKSIFEAGHHTTLQHTHITILIEGMSRHLIWRLLHSHSFYNSEQISQRYAKMKINNFVYPKQANQNEWKQHYTQCFEDYEKLIELLVPSVDAVIPKFRKKDTKKKAQEMARYVLPVGMSAYLYHTVNIITILRYIAVAKSLPEAKEEGMEFAFLLSNALTKLDPALKPLVDYANKSKNTFPLISIDKIKEKHQIKDEKIFVYDVVGDFDIEVNNNYADVLRYSQMYFDEGILGGFNTYIKFSFSADAQNQRHRRSPAIRPNLESIYKKDFYIPPIIEKNDEAKKLYLKNMKLSYDFFESQKEKIGFSEAIYALPNAHNIEIIERNDFSSFHHKAQMRLCYNAQEEIYDVVYSQVSQLQNLKIKGSEYFLPPCTVRANLGIRPICPEGDHYCGIKVWKLDFKDYNRDI